MRNWRDKKIAIRDFLVADYFTKPLQGMIFQQLRDMIMGSTDIALPTGTFSSTTDQMSRIPAVPTQQESRSVLDNEIKICGLPRLLTVLPVYIKANDNTVRKPSKLVVGNGRLSWADILARGRKRW
jgi:hypothetical protein